MRNYVLALLLSISLLSVTTAFGPPAATVSNNEIILSFPETATFRATITSDVEITSVVLEYGNEQQTCGEVVAKAFPQFTPGTSVDVEWTWEMLQSGSLPPGAQIWWRWRILESNGNETVTEEKTAVWLDDTHNWNSVAVEETIRLHWYEGDEAFALDLAEAAANGLDFNETRSGLIADAPIDIYIYADTNDLKDAILYEPSWVGGSAYAEQNIVIIGISPGNLDWGRNAMVHELTHVLVGHLTFSCLGDVPTWLNEGLAVYSEGELDPGSQQQLDEAIRNNTLLSVRSLSAGFSEVRSKVDLSYAQSYSVVKFLIDTYGQEKMTSLLLALRDGSTIDEALLQTYGFDVEGLEDAWRQAIGAQPRTSGAQPTAQPTPTFVPTIVPIGGSFSIPQVTSTPVPTSSFSELPTEQPAGPPIVLTLILLAVCCAFIGLIGIFILGVVIRNQNRRGGSNVQ